VVLVSVLGDDPYSRLGQMCYACSGITVLSCLCYLSSPIYHGIGHHDTGLNQIPILVSKAITVLGDDRLKLSGRMGLFVAGQASSVLALSEP
jgi:hypothetical protein